MARIRGGRRRDAIWRLRIRFFESHHHLFSGKFSSSKEARAGADVVSVPFPKDSSHRRRHRPHITHHGTLRTHSLLEQNRDLHTHTFLAIPFSKAACNKGITSGYVLLYIRERMWKWSGFAALSTLHTRLEARKRVARNTLLLPSAGGGILLK